MGNREIYGKFALNIEYLMFTNFVALTFCLKTWTVFLCNEALCFINYRLIWEKILKCKGEQIDLKTELKLPNNLFYLY
jgi:hypothetical protein